MTERLENKVAIVTAGAEETGALLAALPVPVQPKDIPAKQTRLETRIRAAG